MNLEIKNLYFSYGHHEAVKDVSFSAAAGEIVAILGVNGAGKSTMLKCINKINHPSSGDILVDGSSINKMSNTELAKKIGYVAQNCEFSDSTVFDSVLLGRKPFIKWDITARDLEIVQDVLHMLSLEEYAMRGVFQLSGGERQKVAIARALAQQTPVLLFDEPTSNLDMKNQLEVLHIIKDIVRQQKLTAIVTIHDLNLALRYADRFLTMKEGTIFAFGGSETITAEMIREVYGVDADVTDHNGHKVVIPR